MGGTGVEAYILPMPVRQTYILMPPGTALALYLAALVVGVICVWGLARRLRGVGVIEAVRGAPGGPVRATTRLIRLGILQGRVLRRRRGWLHAAVVVGTLLAALGTTLVFVDWDLLRPLGHRLLEGHTYLVFEALLDAAGLLLVAGAGGGLLWRILRPPEQPRRAHRQHTAALATLLAIGVSGFLLEALRLTLRPSAGGGWSFVGYALAGLLAPLAGAAYSGVLYQVVWWGHASLALLAIAALSTGVVVHVLAAPLDLMASTARPRPALDAPFDLRDLMRTQSFDVRAGSSRLEHFDAAHRLSLLACMQCGRCRDVCPAYLSGSGLDPRRLVQRLSSVLGDGSGERDLVGMISEDENLWSCTTCGACAQECPALVRPVDFVVPFRRELVARQQLDARPRAVLANLSRFGNPYGVPGRVRAEAASEVGLPSISEAQADDWLYWVGCAGAFDRRARDVVRATVRVLRAGGLRVTTLGEEESCTGDPARRLGEEGLFQQQALANLETLERHGVRRIVTHCAHCFNVLKNEYRDFGGRFEVLHHTELIARLLRSGKLRLSSSPLAEDGGDPVRVTLHDACTLARLNEATDAPRGVLDAVAGLDRVEMRRSGRRTFCCGSGGGVAWSAVTAVDAPATLRAREALATRARYLAVECPFCLKSLEESTTNAAGPEVRDVAELVALALPSGPDLELEASPSPAGKATGGRRTR